MTDGKIGPGRILADEGHHCIQERNGNKNQQEKGTVSVFHVARRIEFFLHNGSGVRKLLNIIAKPLPDL
jgi:hypothetical protein